MTSPSSQLSLQLLTIAQFKYRLNKCGELCFGIFCTVDPKSGFQAETLSTGNLVETDRKNAAISVLLGHVVAAKTNDLVATDESMDYPKDWDSACPQPSAVGHQEGGRTIVLHSIAILPAFQGRGLGQILTKAYIQNMTGAGIADRLALIAHDVSLKAQVDSSSAKFYPSTKFHGTKGWNS